MDKHTFGYEHNGSKVVWDVRDIWQAVEDLPTIKLSTELFKEVSKNVFKEYDKSDFDRIREVDLSHPIIIPKSAYNTGSFIIDGYHRLYRHIQLKHKTIPVKVLEKMPRPLYCKGKPFEIEGLDFDWYDPRKK